MTAVLSDWKIVDNPDGTFYITGRLDGGRFTRAGTEFETFKITEVTTERGAVFKLRAPHSDRIKPE